MRMPMPVVLFTILVLGTMLSCNSKSKGNQEPVSREQEIENNLQQLKEEATDGDLLVRMNDDIISVQIKNFNRTDKSFSHAGIIVTRNGRKMVCNISPDANRTDTVKFEPIDSFINTRKHLSTALFRYDLTEEEKTAFVSELNNYHSQEIHFDWKYDLDTDTALYCSEMITKAIGKATGNRIQFESHLMPPRVLPLLNKYFEGQVRPDVIEKRPFFAIDNLYLIPECKEIMRFRLKHFPGQ